MSSTQGRPLVRPSSAHPRRALERKLSNSGIPIPGPPTNAIGGDGGKVGVEKASSMTRLKIPTPVITPAPTRLQRAQSMVFATVSPRGSIPERRATVTAARPKSATGSIEMSKTLVRKPKATDDSMSDTVRRTASDTPSQAPPQGPIAGLQSQLATLTQREQGLIQTVATKDDALRHYQHQVHHLQGVLAETQRVCAKFQTDCEALADKALTWKKKFEKLEVEHATLQTELQRTPRKVANSWAFPEVDAPPGSDDATFVESFEAEAIDRCEMPSLVVAAEPDHMPGHLREDDVHTTREPELQIQALRSEVARHMEDKRALEAKMRDLENELQRFKQHIVHLSNDHDEQVAELQEQLCSASADHDSGSNHADNTQRKYHHVRKQLAVARGVMRELQVQVSLRDALVQQQQAELKSSRKANEELEDKTRVLVALQERYDRLHAQLQRERAQRAAPSAPDTSHEFWQAQCRGVTATLKKTKAKHKAEISGLQLQMQIARREYAEVALANQESAHANQESAHLRQELDEAREAYARLRESSERQRVVRAGLRRRNFSLYRTVVAVTAARDKLANDAKQLELKFSTAKRAFDQVHSEGQVATANLATLQSTYDAMVEEFAERIQQCDAMVALHHTAILACMTPCS
ncbi:hypothetical protein ACHHYP_05062 [Achlya hypogyna]|uniref:Uncharacterized protein n=1 Tax=Achlya hypogyna TaxID=1202772 RepID=A0A1V9YZN7_ACHHY|nr:hypothetical protein ACHHYP_05062 [Achlya hypogyna]